MPHSIVVNMQEVHSGVHGFNSVLRLINALMFSTPGACRRPYMYFVHQAHY